VERLGKERPQIEWEDELDHGDNCGSLPHSLSQSATTDLDSRRQDDEKDTERRHGPEPGPRARCRVRIYQCEKARTEDETGENFADERGVTKAAESFTECKSGDKHNQQSRDEFQGLHPPSWLGEDKTFPVFGGYYVNIKCVTSSALEPELGLWSWREEKVPVCKIRSPQQPF
jgi:hypothetical protein